MIHYRTIKGDFRWRGRGPQNRARITVKSTRWFALFSGSCLASSTLAGQFLLFVKFSFFDLLSIQILVFLVSLSRHLRTIMHHPERGVASDRVDALVRNFVITVVLYGGSTQLLLSGECSCWHRYEHFDCALQSRDL